MLSLFLEQMTNHLYPPIIPMLSGLLTKITLIIDPYDVTNLDKS